MYAVGPIYDEKYMPRLVAPLIFFLLFFVFCVPLRKHVLLDDRLSPFLAVSLSLLFDPAPLLSPRVTWDLVMMIPARNVHGGPIYRDREPIPVYLRSQWPSPYARIILPPKVVRYFFIFSFASSLQERFLPCGQYLTNIDFGIRLLLAFSVSFFDSIALFACKTKYSPWNVKIGYFLIFDMCFKFLLLIQNIF